MTRERRTEKRVTHSVPATHVEMAGVTSVQQRLLLLAIAAQSAESEPRKKRGAVEWASGSDTDDDTNCDKAQSALHESKVWRPKLPTGEECRVFLGFGAVHRRKSTCFSGLAEPIAALLDI